MTQYNLASRRVIGKSLPLQNNYFKTAPLRAPQAPQSCFAYEQLIDELAHAANMDPYLFRLQNIATLATDMKNGLTALTWDGWKNVLTKSAALANWHVRSVEHGRRERRVRVRLGRAAAGEHRCGNCQRVLRRHGCAHP